MGNPDKTQTMIKNWQNPTFKEILRKEATTDKGHLAQGLFKRLYMYLRAIELREQGHSFKHIRAIINYEIGDAPGDRTLATWLKGKASPIGRIHVFDITKPEIGFILGAIITEGTMCITKQGEHLDHYLMEFNNQDETFIEEFKKACHELGLATYERLEKSGLGSYKIRVEVKSALLYLLLKHYSQYILNANPEAQRLFIKAVFWGDGYIGHTIELNNTDLELIKTVGQLLQHFGIKWTLRGPWTPKPPGKKPIYSLHIRLRYLENFKSLIKLSKPSATKVKKENPWKGDVNEGA